MAHVGGGGGDSGGAEGEGGDGIPASATVAAETATRQQVVADASAAKDPRQVQGPRPPVGRVPWTFQNVQGPIGGVPFTREGVLQSDVRISMAGLCRHF